MSQWARVNKVNLNSFQRVIIMSDIHGDDEGFVGVLNELEFSKQDALVIVGDILEKGKDSLKLLKRLIQMNQDGNIFLVLGNNETLFEEWRNHEISNEEVLWYLKIKEQSVLIDMAHELQLDYQTIEDIEILKEAIFQNYSSEIEFLGNLAHILECEFAIFVHAGIDPTKPLENQEEMTCLSASEFAKTKHYFNKPVIVGHWPASNYCDKIIDIRCYHNQENNVISIDGGNSMKSWGQINYLIYENKKFVSGYYDRCQKIKVLDAQKESQNPISLIFPQTHLLIKEEYEMDSLCYVCATQQELRISNSHLYDYKGQKYCYDFTTYHLEVLENEIVSYCEDEEDGILIKKNGIVGKYNGRYKKM